MSTRSRRRRSRRAPALGERLRLFLPARSWRLQLLGAAIGLCIALFSAQSLASAREGANIYQIRPGDTLLTIASVTGVSIDRLIGINAISNPDLIIAGDSLQLDATSMPSTARPAANASPNPAGASATNASANQAAGVRYMVQAGDTLWDLAKRSGTTVENLLKLNNLDNADQLTVGQQLAMPAPPAPAAGQTAAATPASDAAKPKPGQPAQGKQTAAAKTTLLQKVTAEAQRVGGPDARVGVAALNLVTGEKLSLNGDASFPSASVIKLPLLVELERQAASGNVVWTEALRAQTGAMISVSDNNAANQIAQTVKPQSVNDTMARLGLGNTRFLNLFSDSRGPSNPGQNQTTPGEMVRLLELIATDQIVNPQVSADIRGLLLRNADRSKLVRLLPKDAAVAHKSGWYDGVANDVGIVTVDRVPTRWAIAVFTQNVKDGETGNQLVAAISKAVYDAWAPQ